MAELSSCPICKKAPTECSRVDGEFYFNCCGIDIDTERSYERATESWNKIVKMFIDFSKVLVNTPEKAQQ